MDFMDGWNDDKFYEKSYCCSKSSNAKLFHAQTKFHFYIKITTQLKQDINLTGNNQTICCLKSFHSFFKKWHHQAPKKYHLERTCNEDEFKMIALESLDIARTFEQLLVWCLIKFTLIRASTSKTRSEPVGLNKF